MKFDSLYRKTIGVTPRHDGLQWVSVKGFRGTIKSVCTGIVTSKDINEMAVGLRHDDKTTVGVSISERFIKHWSRIVSKPEDITGKFVDHQFEMLIPDELDRNKLRYSWQSKPNGTGAILSMSAVNKRALERDSDSTLRYVSDIQCLSSIAQDLPFVLAYRDDFVVGASYVITADSELSRILEYQNSLLLGATSFYGNPDHVLPDLEMELIRLSSNNLPTKPVTVVGSATNQFITNADDHSIGIEYRCLQVPREYNWAGSINSNNAGAAALAIRLFYEGATGFNFATSTIIADSLTSRLERTTRADRRTATFVAAAFGVLLLFCSYFAQSQVNNLNQELDVIQQGLSSSESARLLAAKRGRVSAEVQPTLRNQTNVAATLEGLGRARTPGTQWRRFSLSVGDDNSASVSVRGEANDPAVLTSFVSAVEDLKHVDATSISTAAGSRFSSTSAANTISFELDTVIDVGVPR